MIALLLLLMLCSAICMSALFSGTETGFYRVTRVRLVLDALGGNWLARCLVWLANNPTVVIATTLTGNNLANYVATLAMVLLVERWSPFPASATEVLAPLLLTPLLFVYGELLPKYLFHAAPNQLLRRAAIPLLCFTFLFAPITAVLWILGRVVQATLGESPATVRSRLARQELERLLEEGHETGILRPIQRQLSQALFIAANDPVTRFSTPLGQSPVVSPNSSRSQVLRAARRHGTPLVIVRDERGRRLMGYVRVFDLLTTPDPWTRAIQPFLLIAPTTSHLNALVRLQNAEVPVGLVGVPGGRTWGLLYRDRLLDPLLPGNRN